MGKQEIDKSLFCEDGQGSLQALICEGCFFEGKISFEGYARIAGTFKGSIEAKGTLVIEASAKVEADIKVDHLILFGECSGEVLAKKSLIMEPPARFVGAVSSPSLSIKEGCFFEGSSKKIQE